MDLHDAYEPDDIMFDGSEAADGSYEAYSTADVDDAAASACSVDDGYFAALVESAPPEYDLQDPGMPPEPQAQARTPVAAAQLTSGEIIDELCVILAGLNQADVADAQQLIRQIRRSTPVLSAIDESERREVTALLNLLSFETEGLLDGGQLDLAVLPRERLYGAKVKALVARLRSLSGSAAGSVAPHRQFKALEEQVQRHRSARSVTSYLEALRRQRDTDELLSLYRRFEPPTTSRAVENAEFARTAAQWEAEEAAALAGRPRLRISSGYRALDSAMTKDGEPLGSWAGGELHVIAAPTGNGKSAHSRRTLTAAAEDLVNGWGLTRARVYHAITEEEPSIVAAAAELLKGQKFHHLADNVTIAKIGASRTRLIKGLYDLVIQADDESRDTGLPISEFLPYVVIIDYIGGIVEDGEPADTVAIEKSANLAMRGIAAWDFEMMAQFSGVSFAEYAGRPVPKGMSHHRCAVITYAQTLSKVDGRLWFEPGSSTTPIGDFTVEKPDGSLGWNPLKGDFRVPQRKDVRGSGVLLNHATSLIILHRSRPENNEVRRRSDGLVHVDDDRARFILAKVRNASSMPFVPMRFDSQRNGPRGQFYDLMAEELIRQGKLRCAPCHREEGDPILPVRPARRPLAGVRY